MSNDPTENLGHIDDEAEDAETSSDATGGPAADGQYDPAEGSPADGTPGHPVSESFPDEPAKNE